MGNIDYRKLSMLNASWLIRKLLKIEDCQTINFVNDMIVVVAEGRLLVEWMT